MFRIANFIVGTQTVTRQSYLYCKYHGSLLRNSENIQAPVWHVKNQVWCRSSWKETFAPCAANMQLKKWDWIIAISFRRTCTKRQPVSMYGAQLLKCLLKWCVLLSSNMPRGSKIVRWNKYIDWGFKESGYHSCKSNVSWTPDFICRSVHEKVWKQENPTDFTFIITAVDWRSNCVRRRLWENSWHVRQ